MKSLKVIISFILSVATAVIGCACTDSESSQIETIPTEVVTTAPVQETTTFESTDDTAVQPATYNYVAIKQKADDITAKFDKIITDEGYKGVTYFKIGNDFEYINETGYANTEKHINNSINTSYYVGSITKQFTASAIMKLSEEGKLSVDDTLDKYYPSYTVWKNITIKNLLTMTSGIENYVVADGEAENSFCIHEELKKSVKKDNSKKENKNVIIKWLSKQELKFESGTKFEYSDSDYYILGDIIEKVSKISYETYMKENIFEPLKMSRTGFGKSKNLANSYGEIESGKELLYNGVAYSSLGLISTTSDLLKWCDALFDNKVISENSINEMFTPFKDNFAYGVYVDSNRVSISGMIENYSSMISYTTDESEVYISISNDNVCDPLNIFNLFKNSIEKYYR